VLDGSASHASLINCDPNQRMPTSLVEFHIFSCQHNADSGTAGHLIQMIVDIMAWHRGQVEQKSRRNKDKF